MRILPLKVTTLLYLSPWMAIFSYTCLKRYTGILSTLVFYTLLTVFFFLFYKKINDSKGLDESQQIAIRYTFLSFLLIFSVNQLLHSTFIDNHSRELTATAIVFGLLTVHIYKTASRQNNPTDEIDRAHEKEPMLNGALLSRITLTCIVILGAILRCWNLKYIQWSDNFNYISAQALFENGHYIYNRNFDYTRFTALLFSIFEPSLPVARIFPLIFGIASIYLIYHLGKIYNKHVGLISAFLMAISPIAIEKSSFIREYSLNSFIFLSIIIVLFKIFELPVKFYYKLFSSFGILSFVFLYSALTKNTTLPITVFGILIILLYYTFYRDKKITLKSIVPAVFLLIVFNLLTFRSDQFHAGFRFQSEWIQVFFDPRISYPMQWFNGSQINTFLIAFFFLSPLVILKNDKIKLLYLLFGFYVLFFVTKFNNTLTYLPTRYIYHIHFIYTCIFALSLYLFNAIFITKKEKTIFYFFLLTSLIIPKNTILGAQHYADLTDGYKEGNYPRVTSVGSRPDVEQFMQKLKQLDLIEKNSPLVLEGLDQAFILAYFDYDVDGTRDYIMAEKYHYDVGVNIFIEDKTKQMNGLQEAIKQFKSGVFITYQSMYPRENFELFGTKFIYLDQIDTKKIYRWEN